MKNLHPLLVHLPIALLPFGVLLDFLSVILKREDTERAAWWCLLAGTIGLAATVGSGIMAKNTVTIHTAAESTLESHEEIAMLVGGLFAFLILWRISCRSKLPEKLRFLYLLIALGATVLMLEGAYLGGKLVFTFGIGVG